MIDPQAGISLLMGKIAKANTSRTTFFHSIDIYRDWVGATGVCLERIFGEDDTIVQRFFNSTSGTDPRNIPAALLSQIGQLEDAIEILEAEARSRPKDATAPQQSKHQDSRKVFVVHGHNDAIKEQAARFLERIDLTPIILVEQASAGMTVIEMFEQHSEVSFAVVLLTADDKGGVKNSPPENLHLRARQNVIFELGYFVAKLGRKKVCAIYEEGVEIPSDYKGVIFVPLDVRGAWRLRLAKEMKEAGLEVDMNKI
jgi:predicted nucleotide-binding protein